VTEGAHERAFTALVYNGVSIQVGLWHAILLNLKNHVKTGELAGRVRAARSEKNRNDSDSFCPDLEDGAQPGQWE
jgi:hypothetical protein